jgi:hypothetical protein
MFYSIGEGYENCFLIDVHAGMLLYLLGNAIPTDNESVSFDLFFLKMEDLFGRFFFSTKFIFNEMNRICSKANGINNSQDQVRNR